MLYMLSFSVLGTLELSALCFFLYRILGFNPKLKRIYRLILFLTSFLLIVLLMNYAREAAWRTIVNIVLLCVLALLVFGGRMWERLFFFFINLAAMFFSSAFVWSIISVYYRNAQESMSDVVSYVFFPLSAVLGDVILLFFVLHISKKSKLYLPRKHWIIAIASLSAIMTVDFFLVMTDVESTEQGLVFSVIALGMLLLWATVYFAVFFASRYSVKMGEAMVIAAQNEAMERYLIQKMTSDRMIKVLSHDLRHNLDRFKALAEQSGDARAGDAVAEYERLLENYQMLDVGNEIANAIINDKFVQRGNVTFMVSGGFDDGLTLSPIDLCSLLGNLLDNALEAAAESDRGFVKISINRQNHMLLLSLENSYKHEPKMSDGAFVSRKKDGGLHGIGSVSIRNVVEKYNGVIDSEYGGGVFKASLMLRGYE